MRSKIIGDVQVLRALAVTMVVTYHSYYSSFLPQHFRSGFTGVDLFFVISGFVIARGSFELIKRNSGWSFTGAFLKRRAKRIAPAALTWLAIYWVVFAIAGTDVTGEVIQIVTLRYNYLLAGQLDVLGHYWSLVVEEHFYLVFAFTFAWLVRWRVIVPTALVGIAFATLVFRPLAADPMHFTQARFDSFLCGVLIAWVGRLWRWPEGLAWRLAGMVLSVPLTIGIWILFSFQGVPHAFTAMMGMCSALVLIASADRDVVLPIPGLRPALEWVGERSYSLYLSHPLLVYADNFGRTYSNEWLHLPTLARILISIAAALAVADLSYRLLERRRGIGKLVARLRSPFSGRQGGAARTAGPAAIERHAALGHQGSGSTASLDRQAPVP